MDSLRQAAAELSIPERTLKRAAAEGLIRGERISPRRFRVNFREETYLRSHWGLLHTLRATLRTEPNVRLAVLFGSTANGDDCEDSDIDVLVVLADPSVGRLVGLTERLSARLGRDLQLVRLADAEKAPVLMADVIEQGRVLVDREERWRGLQEAMGKWRRLARRVENAALAGPLGDLELDHRLA
ncbi:MAG TPA: nucleotidyltransferase domain-containing protein [Solirubrobacteraceae bacterium]|nr:nucleotidyltransferase domain-containing protein [Solirubrobacteraceae bacterium]